MGVDWRWASSIERKTHRRRHECAVWSFLERANIYSVLKYNTKPEFSTFCRLVCTAMQFTADRRHALAIHDHPEEIWWWRRQRRMFHTNTCSRGRELDCDACALSAGEFLWPLAWKCTGVLGASPHKDVFVCLRGAFGTIRRPVCQHESFSISPGLFRARYVLVS